MALTVPIRYRTSVTVPTAVDEVKSIILDPPQLLAHFPKLEKMELRGDDTFYWRTIKLGPGEGGVRIHSRSRYRVDPAAGALHWEPLPEEGNATLSGQWLVLPHDAGTRIEVEASCDVTLPFPGWLRFIVAPIVEHEFHQLVNDYVSNLENAFGVSVNR